MNFSKVVADLRNSFNSGKSKDVEWRVKQLKSLYKFYDENSNLFVETIHKDLRKPRWESLTTEINFLKNDVIGCLRDVQEWAKPFKAEKSFLTLLDDCVIRPEPYGVVLIIGAWNYPLHLTLAPLAGAIAAGNCAIIKPSEISPHTAEAIEQLLTKYLDPECFQVINGGVQETTELLKEKFDYIFYTGSTGVGKIIRDAANKHLTPTTLELGGKSPVYIDPDANIEVAAKRILWGKMINLGQTCIAPDYVLCSKKTESKLLAQTQKIIREWFGEDPKKSEDLTRIVSDRHFDRLVELVKKSNGSVKYGGNYDKSERYLELTIITDLDPSDPVMQEELFGPILPIITVNSAREAISFINSRDKPLTMYVYTENKKIQELFMAQTSSGGMAINECLLQLSVESLPFGGVGASGMGAYHGKASFDTFSHFKSILIRDLGFLGEKIGAIRYPPYNYRRLPVLEQMLYNRKLPNLTFLKYLAIFLLGGLIPTLGILLKWF